MMAAVISCDQQMAAQRRPLRALTNSVWLMTGLGLASRLWRQRWTPAAPQSQEEKGQNKTPQQSAVLRFSHSLSPDVAENHPSLGLTQCLHFLFK